jgi:hypothetical protein
VAITIERISAPIQSGAGAQIARTLPNTLAIGDQVAVLVMHGSATSLSAVAGWTKSAEVIRSVSLAAALYTAKVTTAGEQTSLQTFTYPAGSVVWREISEMVRIQGAADGPESTGTTNTGPAAATGSTGVLAAAPSVTGALVLGIVATSGNTGGDIDDATYPTNGFSISHFNNTTNRRSTSVYKENQGTSTTSSTVKWATTSTTFPVGIIASWVPTGTPPPPPNVPPVANAGVDQTVAAGDTLILAGSGVDSDGSIAAYEWTPPFGVTLTNAEVQTITLGGTGLTSFTLTYSGQTTAAIATPATAALITTRLEALSNIGTGDVQVFQQSSTVYRVTFKGALLNTNVAQMTATPTGGTGTVTIDTVRAGGTGTATAIANPTWIVPTTYTDYGDKPFLLRVQDDDGAWSTSDTAMVTVTAAPTVPGDPPPPPPPPPPPTPGVTEVPQWVSTSVTYSTQFNTAKRIVEYVRLGGAGTGGGGATFPYTLPFTLGGVASASGDTAYVRKAFSGPGETAAFSVGGGGGFVVIERAYEPEDDSPTIEVIRGGNGIPVEADGSAQVVDGEAWPHRTQFFRVKAIVQEFGVMRGSQWSDWLTVTPTPNLPSVSDPTDPDNNTVLLSVIEFGQESKTRLGARHVLLGSGDDVETVMVSTGWTAESGSLTAFTDNKQERDRLFKLLISGNKLLLQVPSEDGNDEGEMWYFEPDGDISRSRLVSTRNPARSITVSWIEVSKP